MKLKGSRPDSMLIVERGMSRDFVACGRHVVGSSAIVISGRAWIRVDSQVSERRSATVAVIHVAGKLSDAGLDAGDSRFDC